MRRLALPLTLALVVASGCGGGNDLSPAATAPGTTTSAVPAALRPAVAAFRRQVHAPDAPAQVLRGRHGPLAARLGAPSAPDPDREVVVVALRGPVDFRQAASPDPADRRVRGRFAFVVLDPADGEQLGFGVLPAVPAGFR